MCVRIIVAAALLSATPIAATRAQMPWTGTDRVDAMTHAVVDALHNDIAAALSGHSSLPWRMTVSSPDTVRWRGVFTRLRGLLHARVAVPSDGKQRVLAIRETAVTDSASTYGLTVRFEWRCAGPKSRWVATEEAWEIVVLRTADHWEARPDPHPVIGEPVPCI